MSSVLGADFDYTIHPSGGGTGVLYGSCTISTGAPIRTYSRDECIQVIPPSGTNLPSFMSNLEGRYVTPPSGWNAIVH